MNDRDLVTLFESGDVERLIIRRDNGTGNFGIVAELLDDQGEQHLEPFNDTLDEAWSRVRWMGWHRDIVIQG
ncbi:hypothetical protein [Allochromatium palmeri]|uniref:Uncharacterized protein n=1 Tax=Allochromatium palmeri TaxID=231048 RepID=A0A6N8EHW9_9GAMM|nr:hypothetical protein [Allochromatium palmeri]MTW23211.1 hypothetical protein [Allochromatium palmeri]